MKYVSILLLLSIACTLALYGDKSPVVRLTVANFKEKVLDSKEPWFIEFYAPWCGHCKALKPHYEEVAQKLDGIFNIGAVDMTTEQSVGQPYGIQGFPTLKYFGENKKSPEDYNGGRTTNDIINFIKQKNPHLFGNVVKLTEKNFDDAVLKSKDPWFVQFFKSKECPQCSKHKLDWSKTGTKLKGLVKVGKVDATLWPELAEQFGVTKFPHYLYFPAGNKDKQNLVEFQEKFSLKQTVTWAKMQLENTQPIPTFTQLTSQEVFEKQCASIKSTCIIALLPSIADSTEEARKGYIELLHSFVPLSKGRQLSFFWAQGGDHKEFEQSLNLDSGYPLVLGYNARQSTYAIMKQSYYEDGLKQFINRFYEGRERSKPFEGTLKFNKVAEYGKKTDL